MKRIVSFSMVFITLLCMVGTGKAISRFETHYWFDFFKIMWESRYEDKFEYNVLSKEEYEQSHKSGEASLNNCLFIYVYDDPETLNEYIHTRLQILNMPSNSGSKYGNYFIASVTIGVMGKSFSLDEEDMMKIYNLVDDAWNDVIFTKKEKFTDFTYENFHFAFRASAVENVVECLVTVTR